MLRAGRGFGSDALKVDGKIFASLSHGRLLVKLPVERVKALVDAKLGEPFSTGPGRVKKEWVTLAPSSVEEWVRVSEEARRYVRSKARIGSARLWRDAGRCRLHMSATSRR